MKFAQNSACVSICPSYIKDYQCTECLIDVRFTVYHPNSNFNYKCKAYDDLITNDIVDCPSLKL